MMRLICGVALVLGAVALADEGPPPVARTPQHEWLEQLLGEWTVTVEMSMGPGTEPMKMESTESVRSLAGLWVVADGKGTVGGKPMASLMTIGYDPAQKAFIGTWVDTMGTHMWVYRGQLDEAKKVLALEAEGPSFDDPTKKSTYRDAIEIVAPDHKILTSSVKNADGTWTKFMTANYRRKK